MNDSTLREIGGPPVASAMGRRGRVLRQAVAVVCLVRSLLPAASGQTPPPVAEPEAGASAKASAGETPSSSRTR